MTFINTMIIICEVCEMSSRKIKEIRELRMTIIRDGRKR